MLSSRVGQVLRSAAVFILLIVLGDSAMTSVRSQEVFNPTIEYSTLLERTIAFRADGGVAAAVPVYVINR